MAMEDWVKGAIVGVVAGVVLGVLLAPKSGAESRQDLNKLGEDLKKRAGEESVAALQGLQRIITEAATIGGEKKSRIFRALDAAVTAFNEEKNGSETS